MKGFKLKCAQYRGKVKVLMVNYLVTKKVNQEKEVVYDIFFI